MSKKKFMAAEWRGQRIKISLESLLKSSFQMEILVGKELKEVPASEIKISSKYYMRKRIEAYKRSKAA